MLPSKMRVMGSLRRVSILVYHVKWSVLEWFTSIVILLLLLLHHRYRLYRIENQSFYRILKQKDAHQGVEADKISLLPC